MIREETLSIYAMCRECALEFGSISQWYQMKEHVRLNPGHVIIGTEQIRIIVKGDVCIAH